MKDLVSKMRKGFTIVELLIYMGVVSALFLVMTELFATIFDVKTESEATSSVEYDGRFILSRLIYDVSRSSAITTPASYGGSGSTLVLTIGGVANTYAVSGGVLQLTNGSGTDRLNGSETTFSNLVFQKVGSESADETVKISFTVSSVTQRNNGFETRNFQTTVGRR